MQITLIDRTFDMEETFRQGKYLWSVAPFAERINWVVMYNAILTYAFDHHRLTEREKIDYYKISIRLWKTEITPTFLEEVYQRFLKMRHQKHKDKKTLLFLNKWKNIFNAYHQESLNFIKSFEKQLQIEELHPLFGIPKSNVICLYNFDSYQPTEYSSFEIEVVTTTILQSYELPLFSDRIEKFIDTENTKIFRQKLLEFISPISLTFGKLEIIRNEFVSKFKLFTDYLEKLYLKISMKKFEESVIAELENIFQSEISSIISVTQTAIDDNIYFNQITNSVEDAETVTMFLCACSVNDLLNFFLKVSEFPKITIDNAREELKGKIDLEATTFFIYSKIKKQ